MPRVSSVWECQSCGGQFPKWAGKCPDCNAWTSLVETVVSPREIKNQKKKKKNGNRGQAKPEKLSDILKDIDTTSRRITTGIGELDRVLGGGLVPGQVALLAGEPGMGKSTLLSQVALQMAGDSRLSVLSSQLSASGQSVISQPVSETDKPKTGEHVTENRKQKTDNRTVLYVCGEESPPQVGLRLRRLAGSRFTIHDSLLSLYPQTDVDLVSGQIEKLKPGLVIIDSIQTLSTADLSGLAGAVGQIRECTARLSQIAKSLNIPLFLVGHVTKEGEVAGPKVLEHMVDTVLVMEGDRSGNLRILRSLKNRFGPVDEVGIFSMDDAGMAEVKNPAELLVGDFAGRAPGSVLG